jgi:glycosyltransferase involved in cell wall biosynthesis
MKMEDEQPLVSIVLPTYNGSEYIRQSIDSCLNQTYRNIELIIVDDCSTDETPDIIKSYKDERIKYIRHERNKRLPTALNTGFANSKGEFLTWTSDDNYYAPEAIEKMKKVLMNNKCDFVYCDFYRFENENLQNRRIKKLPDILSLDKNNDVGACFLYSKKVRDAVGNYDPTTELAEDYDYWIRVSKNFHMYHLNEILYGYREHHTSLSLSRTVEVQIASILVRIKNKIVEVDSAVNLLIDIIEHNYPKKFKLNRIILKLLYHRKIKKEISEYTAGISDFVKTKRNLMKIVINK